MLRGVYTEGIECARNDNLPIEFTIILSNRKSGRMPIWQTEKRLLSWGLQDVISTILMSVFAITPNTKSLPSRRRRYRISQEGNTLLHWQANCTPTESPIEPEERLASLIKLHTIDEVVFSYSDVSHEYVMHKASLVNASGAQFTLLGTRQTMIKSRKPVVAVCAVRTGSGKSPASRKVCEIIKEMGKRVVVVRHPMPYGDLLQQRLQRFALYDDFQKHDCTIEEIEEYEPHVEQHTVVYAGVDYAAILAEAEEEADIIVWDGGNNDTLYAPDIHITMVDPHRAGT